MIRALIAILRSLRHAWLLELAGAGLIVGGLYEAWGVAAALIGGGVGLLLKAFEIDGGT